jgi:hypothetical protein
MAKKLDPSSRTLNDFDGRAFLGQHLLAPQDFRTQDLRRPTSRDIASAFSAIFHFLSARNYRRNVSALCRLTNVKSAFFLSSERLADQNG